MSPPSVICPEHHALYARVYYRPGAHRARFERHKQLALPEPPAAERPARFVYRLYLGVGEGVFVLFAPVSPDGDYLSVFGYHRADGHFAVRRGLSCKRDRACISSLSVILPLPVYEGHVIKVYVV